MCSVRWNGNTWVDTETGEKIESVRGPREETERDQYEVPEEPAPVSDEKARGKEWLELIRQTLDQAKGADLA